jgi:Putative transposase
MQDRLAEATPRLRDNNYGAGETGSAPSRSTARYSEWLSLNIHLHCLVLEGVYRTNASGESEFVEAAAPSDEQVWEVLQSIIKRLMKQLLRRGILVEDQGETYLADNEDDSEEARALRPLHRGSCVYRIAFGTRAGITTFLR